MLAMAQRVEIVLIDDVDGGTAEETVAFQLDGANYEIDLSRSNAANLRSAIETWSVHARKVGGGRRSARTKRTALGPSTQTIRIWAQANGYQLANRGRVPETIQAAYREAHPSE
jgi:hypothetical protein